MHRGIGFLCYNAGMDSLRIGTCSWKYDSWRGIVYPREGAFDYLQEYGRHFDTVEIDQWFWSLFASDRPALPRQQDVRNYAAAVGEDFRFTVKAPNSVTLTHHYRKDRKEALKENPHFLSSELYGEFLQRLEPMLPKTGAVMLQFEYLNRQKMASKKEFLGKLAAFLAKRPKGPPLAIESRNPNYLDEEYFNCLREHGVHHVFCQGYYMPPVWEIEAKHGGLLSDLAVVRLMGSDRQRIEARSNDRWDRIVEPRDNELAEIVPMLRRLRKRGKTAYVNINNHYEGSAPRTAEKLRALISKNL
jgi:uncharacterized protein YecE (DUF72 family)